MDGSNSQASSDDSGVARGLQPAHQTNIRAAGSLPDHYEPYRRRYQQLRKLRDHQHKATTTVPWYRKSAKFIGNSTYLRTISPLFGYFWLSWKGAHGATMFLADVGLIVYAVVLASGSQVIGIHELSTTQLVTWIGPPLYIQAASPIMTWIFGYIGPRESTYIAHAAVAGLRVVACLGCLVQVYFRKDFGLLHPVASKLVSVLALASLAHLIGAFIRTAQFGHERAQALRNPSDRRIHQGNGFMISYLSLDDQKKQKAAARVQVGIHKHYEQTLSAYWHSPTPELDVQHGVSAGAQDSHWWHGLWRLRTPLQRHVERITYMRQWPLNFEVSSIQHDDLFAHCDCCLDGDDLAEPLQLHPDGLARIQQRREAFLAGFTSFQQRPDPDTGEWPVEDSMGDVMPDAPSVPLHQLCEKCESLCSQSKLMALLIGSGKSRFWHHVRATFTFTHTGPLLEEIFLLWDSAVALRASAYLGCHLCAMLWDSLSPPQQAALVREVNAYTNTDYPKDLGVFVKVLSPHGWHAGRDASKDASNHLYLVTHFGPRRVPRFWMEQKFVLRARSLGSDPLLEHPELLSPVRICLTDPTDLASFAPPSSSPSTGSSAAMNFVKYWLTAHQECGPIETITQTRLVPPLTVNNAQRRAPTRPKRLLEVLQDQRVRLIGDELLTLDVSYVALSYCWHSTQNCILELDTLSRYRDGVPSHELPPTIQDAVHVTQSLGFAYIWIDALCIIQDSEVDKLDQLKDMHGIYAGAAFVIAAAAALDSSQRFLVDQMPHAMSACFLDVDSGNSDNGGDSMSCPPGTNALVALPFQRFTPAAQYELSLSRLKSRGWVYQEEELAATVLYFCDRQLVLMCNLCRKTAIQEYLPHARAREIPNTIWVNRIRFRSAIAIALRTLRDLLSRRKTGVDDELIAHRITNYVTGQISSMEGQRIVTEQDTLPSRQQERWWQLVGEYSARHLSYGNDKLPAIQGLADRFESELLASQDRGINTPPVRYVFGLWSGDALVMGLLWYVKVGNTVRPRPRAPSWSWAAVDGVIGQNSLDGNPHVNACGLSVLRMPETHDHRLVLRALIKPATWRRASDDQRLYYIGHRRHGTVRFQHDLNQYEPLTMDLSQGPEAQLLQDLSGRHVGYLVFDAEGELPNEGSEIHCLRIVVKPATLKEEHDFNVPWASRGLALTKNEEDNTFQRIGYIELLRTPGGISYQSSMNPARQRAERHPAPNVDIGGFFGDCEFTDITIV